MQVQFTLDTTIEDFDQATQYAFREGLAEAFGGLELSLSADDISLRVSPASVNVATSIITSSQADATSVASTVSGWEGLSEADLRSVSSSLGAGVLISGVSTPTTTTVALAAAFASRGRLM